jgi:transposase InsO family protein
LGRIPDGPGWRVLGRAATVEHRHTKVQDGFVYVHAAIDDHSRFAYAEVHPDETAATAASFLLRTAQAFTAAGIAPIPRVITDNAWAYRQSTALRQAVTEIGARQRFIRPHCPWTNCKVERFNRTLAAE